MRINNHLSVYFSVLIYLSIILLVLHPLGIYAQAVQQKVVFEGTYQGSDISVKNAFMPKSNSYAIKKILLNNQNLSFKQNKVIAISLSHLKNGQYISLVITYIGNIKPKLTNYEAIQSPSTYKLISLRVGDDWVKLTTQNETSQEPFILERYAYNKWIKVASLKGQGPAGFSNYTFDVEHFSGENKYIVKQRGLNRRYRITPPVIYHSDKKPITFYPERVDHSIFLSRMADYQIFDQYGRLIKKGIEHQIPLVRLKPGVYYLYVDGQVKRFYKK